MALYTPQYQPQQVAQRQGVRDLYMMGQRLGTRIGLYHRNANDTAEGYAAPGQGYIRISNRDFNFANQLQNRGIVNRHTAHAAYVLAHELGHMNSKVHTSEGQANTWASKNYMYVLHRLGVNPRDARRLFNIARNQLLLV